MNIDIEINISRTNSSKELLVNSSALSTPYIKRMPALNNSPFWTEQVEHTEFQEFFLSYTFPKIKDTGRANKTTVIANIAEPQGEYVNSMDMSTCQPQGLETMSIPYSVNQLVDPSLWDNSVYSISIYSLNKYLEANTTNIIMSLNRIISFIRNRFLNRKQKKTFHTLQDSAMLSGTLFCPSMN